MWLKRDRTAYDTGLLNLLSGSRHTASMSLCRRVTVDARQNEQG